MGQESRQRAFQQKSAAGGMTPGCMRLGLAADQQLSMAITLPEVNRQKAVVRRPAKHGSYKVKGQCCTAIAADACSGTLQRTCHMAQDSGCQIQGSSA